MHLLRTRWAPWVLIAAFAALAYWRVLGCGFVWDDDDYVVQNPVLRTWGGLARIWFEPTSLPQYYPLVHTSFWLEFRLWGLWPAGYHLVNVALHATSALLLWRLGVRLGWPGAAFAALWFLVHPVHVESVAWVTERKNVLSLVCYLLAAGQWLRWHDSAAGAGRRAIVVGTIWFLCALWSKTVTASLPAALLVVLWWRDGAVTRRAWIGALPWLALGAGLGWLTVHLEATHVGAADAPWQLAGAERLLVAGRAAWFYAASLAWPFGACFNYPRWQLDTGSWLQWAAPAGAVLTVAGALLLHRRVGRGPAAALLVFGGTLVPAIGFFDVYPFRYSFVADHFQYHASIAMLVLAAAGLARVASRLREQVVLAAAAIWLTVLAVTAQQLVAQYVDYPTLWRATLEKNPDSALALVNLGGLAGPGGDAAARNAYAGTWPVREPDLEEARRCLARVLELDPTSHEARINLGVVEQTSGNLGEAKRLYEEALRWKPNDPNARNNLAVLELERGDAAAAVALAEQAIGIDPEYFDAHATLGWALTERGEWARARRELEWVLERNPDARQSHGRLVRCLFELGQHGPAAGHALFLMKAGAADEAVQGLLAKAFARVLQQAPVEQVLERAVNGCRNGGVDPGAVLPRIAAELHRLGDEARARKLEGG